MRDLRIGVVGLGRRGRLARQAHRPGGGSRVVVVCDTDPEMHVRVRDWFGDQARATGDVDDVLGAGVDAAMVLSPDDTHEELAVTLLRAGVPVYLEKPMATTVPGCDRILQAAHDHGTRLYVGHNMRHMPVILLMRELIEQGAIGEVTAIWCRHFVGHGGDYYFKDWHADRRRTTSLLLQKGVHDIDVIHWLAGGYTERVAAMGGLTVYGRVTDRLVEPARRPDDDSLETWPPLSQRQLNPVIDVEDLEMLAMRLDNGVFASYQQCQYTPDYWRNYTVIGTEGRLENFGVTEHDAVVRLWNTRAAGYRAAGDKTFPVPAGTGGDHGGADAAIVDEFLRFVRHGGSTNTSPVAARQSVATGALAAQSLRSGGSAVEVPPLDDELRRYFDRGQTTSLAR